MAALLPRSGGNIWTRELARADSGIPSPSALADALRALRDAVPAAPRADGGGPLWLHVALLPPLAHLRQVSLPGVPFSEARRMIQREPSRYMPVAPSTALDVEVEGDGWRGVSPFSVLAAPRAVVDALYAAAEGGGWRISKIVAAQAAWAAALASLAGGRSADGTVVVFLGDRMDCIHVRHGSVHDVRRLPAGAPEDLARVLTPGNDGGAAPVVVIGDSPAAGHVRAALRAAVDVAADTTESPLHQAARHAIRASGPALLPEVERAARRRTMIRHALARFAAAGAVLAAAGLMLWWGAAREGTRIAERRLALRDAVTQAVATRDTLATVLEALATLRSRAGAPTRWSMVFASLSAELPDDAVLAGLTGDGSTLRIEGSAQRAAAVFDAMTRVSGVQAVHADEPIRQNIRTGGVRSERFVLSASLGERP